MPNNNDHLLETLRGLFVRQPERDLLRAPAWQQIEAHSIEVTREIDRVGRAIQEAQQRVAEELGRASHESLQAAWEHSRAVPDSAVAVPEVEPLTPFWDRILANAEEDE